VASSCLDSKVEGALGASGLDVGACFSSLGGEGSLAFWEELSEAACFANSSAPERSSPDSPMTPMTEPTATPLLPSLAYRK